MNIFYILIYEKYIYIIKYYEKLNFFLKIALSHSDTPT